MRHGIVILPQRPWAEARRQWSSAEGLGFDSAWTYDHLSWRSLADQPWQATVPTLVAAATVTTDIRLGTFVASPNFRHPVPFAKEIATLDDIAGGRVQLGVGSGGTGFDASVLGQRVLTPGERHRRFVEFVTALDRLLRHESEGERGISFDGEWFRAVDARMVGMPRQSPRVPLLVAADGPRAIALAVQRGDGWITLGSQGDDLDAWWRSVRERVRRLEDEESREGRRLQRLLSLDAAPRFSLESVGAFEDAEGRASELGFDEVIVHWPRAEGVYAGDEAVLFEVASRF
ncbi:MAG: luciferase [Naasia sp.]|jgi:alkanesulfonate monooxygenase SsuD/methylene tetrahydromethanopterin reductase-like flavin-dependent oxidoreductase (luciferase family)|uniref:LLM class flavin-dependent oxidoreductase n=1 Tax=Naasia sp. TaxID=2546198 RepID=UPI00261C21F7|nr:LLM class flavin-dependent oxidoreductase [Naasia sp.]MCU1571232.1 luciferase [Naasia sp.]